MKCNNCGSDNAANARFCSECGAQLAQVCPKCQTEFAKGDKFCKNCGEPLQKSQKKSSPKKPIETKASPLEIPREAKKKKRNPINVLIPLVSSFIISACIGWVLNRLYPFIDPILDAFLTISIDMPDGGMVKQEIINQAIRVCGAFIISSIISGGITTIISQMFRKKAA